MALLSDLEERLRNLSIDTVAAPTISPTTNKLSSVVAQPTGLQAPTQLTPNRGVGSGLSNFMQSLGYGMVGKPIDLSNQKAGWQSYLGGTLGARIGQGLIDKVLFGEVTPQAKVAKATFYNDPTELNQLGKELEMKAKYSSRVAAEQQKMAYAETIADAIIEGNQPPDLGRLYGYSGAVRKALADKGFNLSKAALDWEAAKKSISALNSPQQQRLRQTIESVEGGIEPLKELSAEFERVGFKPANSLIVKSRINGISLRPGAMKNLGEDQVKIVTRYVTQMNTMRDELAQAFNGGYAPTEASFRLADEILDPAYGSGQLDAALDQLGVNLRIRRTAIMSGAPVGASEGNAYWNRLPEQSQTNSGKDEFRIGQTMKKGGTTYTYEGNGQWSY
jgi:hypothetical protein